MKQVEEQFSMGNFEIDRDFNNIYDIENDFMKMILSDTVQLIPPKDFDYKKLE